MEQENGEFESKVNSDYSDETIGKKDSKESAGVNTPLAAISILTLIGIVCVVIDVFLEKEE